MMAPNSMTRLPPSVMTGDLPSGVSAFSSGGPQPRLRIALVVDDVVGEAELLEQPKDALRARVVQVVDDDHGGVLERGARRTLARRAGVRETGQGGASHETNPVRPRGRGPRLPLQPVLLAQPARPGAQRAGRGRRAVALHRDAIASASPARTGCRCWWTASASWPTPGPSPAGWRTATPTDPRSSTATAAGPCRASSTSGRTACCTRRSRAWWWRTSRPSSPPPTAPISTRAANSASAWRSNGFRPTGRSGWRASGASAAPAAHDARPAALARRRGAGLCRLHRLRRVPVGAGRQCVRVAGEGRPRGDVARTGAGPAWRPGARDAGPQRRGAATASAAAA